MVLWASWLSRTASLTADWKSGDSMNCFLEFTLVWLTRSGRRAAAAPVPARTRGPGTRRTTGRRTGRSSCRFGVVDDLAHEVVEPHVRGDVLAEQVERVEGDLVVGLFRRRVAAGEVVLRRADRGRQDRRAAIDRAN